MKMVLYQGLVLVLLSVMGAVDVVSTCGFDVCRDVPGYCTGGKLCDTNDACQSMCVCGPESTAPECKSASDVNATLTPANDVTQSNDVTLSNDTTTVPTSSQCFPVCEEGFTCLNLGGHFTTCVEDPEPRIDACHSSYTLRDVSERRCLGSECIYGKCHEFGHCECDDNAKGFLCEQRCCRNCGDHGSCFYVDNVTQTCACDAGFTGADCEVELPCSCVHGRCSAGVGSPCECDDGWAGDDCTLSCTIPCQSGYKCVSISNTALTCMPVTTQIIDVTSANPLRVYNACDANYEPRPPEERSCFQGALMCEHGRCVESDQGTYCQCDIGVSPGNGQLCRETCCKFCGEHGRCYYHAQEKEEKCNCDDKYSGDFCEMRKFTPSIGYTLSISFLLFALVYLF